MQRALAALIILAAGIVGIEGDTAASPIRRDTPLHYICMRAPSPPVVDGVLDDPSWAAAAWSQDFVDIEGSVRPLPAYRTRVKMLWDDEYLYVAVELEEPHVWGTLTERDAVIFHDDDFELFIDPDGDTHLYYELEINALGTVWDLLLVKPYRDGGPAIDAWDIAGLRSAVRVRGTLNDPGDIDTGWTVELAVPWAVLEETAPRGQPPRAGDTWRINFSRVDWDMRIEGDAYVKRTDPATGRPLPEHNWVWSPQGAIDMHRPELWGMVQFSDATAGESPPPAFVAPPDQDVRTALRAVYHAQRALRERTGQYASDTDALSVPDSVLSTLHDLSITVGPDGWVARARASEPDAWWQIVEDGRITLKR